MAARIAALLVLFLAPIGRSPRAAGPHGPENNILCLDCHAAPGQQIVKPRGQAQALLCKSCHNPLGQAANMAEVAMHVVGGGATVIDCGACHWVHATLTSDDPHPGGATTANLSLIRPDVGRYVAGALEPAVFQRRPDHFAFADPPFDGVCQACHQQTRHFRNDGGGLDPAHTNLGLAAGEDCTGCHTHRAGFRHGGGGSCGDAGACHGVTGAHAAHIASFEGGGMLAVGCDTCHDLGAMPRFADGHDLAATAVCDGCHSPGGSYDGVEDPQIGAKASWATGVYGAGRRLTPGRERWCAGCHDEAPSVVEGVAAPNVIGDENASTDYGQGVGYGYYRTGHGVPVGATFAATGGAGPGMSCERCHDSTLPHVDGVARTYHAAALDGDPDDYRSGYRLRLIDGQLPLNIPRETVRGANLAATLADFALCLGCHDPAPFTDPGSRDTNFRDTNKSGVNAHTHHLKNEGAMNNPHFDSDWRDGVDSRFSCPTCHNVHGSSRLAMIRDGRLAGREPGLELSYYTPQVVFGRCADVPAPRDLSLLESTGTMFAASSPDNLCDSCHGGCWDRPYLRGPVNLSQIGDADGDGVVNAADVCPVDADPDQADGDGDGVGDACDACPGDPTNTPRPAPDADGDGRWDGCDRCPDDAQNDQDGDGRCDGADPCPLDPLDDADGDGVCGDTDNCPQTPNPGQTDGDGDGAGDACDACPAAPDPDQADSDGDGAGDACDATPFRPAIFGGAAHSIALRPDGTVWAWGANGSGELGDGSTDARAAPAAVAGGETGDPSLQGVMAISTNQAGHFSLALKPDGTVWAWGRNDLGQLGDGAPRAFEPAPVQVRLRSGAPLEAVRSISAGAEFALAVQGDGTTWAWGYGGEGSLGNHARADQPHPVRVRMLNSSMYLTGVSQVAGGEEYSLALRADGVWSWGHNVGGDMDPDPARDWNRSTTAYLVTDHPGFEFDQVTALGAGWRHTLLVDGGVVQSFGLNDKGQLGLADLGQVIGIAAGRYHSLALQADGSLWGAGWNCQGQLGIGQRWDCGAHPEPLQVLIAGPVTAVGAGAFHSLAVSRADAQTTFWSWGSNDQGQLGLGDAGGTELRPVPIPNL